MGVTKLSSGPADPFLPGGVVFPLSVESESLLLVSPLPDISISLASIKCASPSDAGLPILPAESVLAPEAADTVLSGDPVEFTDSLDIR